MAVIANGRDLLDKLHALGLLPPYTTGAYLLIAVYFATGPKEPPR